MPTRMSARTSGFAARKLVIVRVTDEISGM